MDLAAELSRFGPKSRHSPVSLADAEAYCRKLARSHYENFTVASRLFPRHLHQHLANVYAYCRWADDLADEVAGTLRVPSPEHGTQSAPTTLELLDWWEGQLDAMYAGEATHPVFVALAETVRHFGLPRQPLADLLIAFRRDQVQTRYETRADLLTYCEKSANPVGRIVLCLGRSLDDENVRLSDSICTGLQLANFWQDVCRDYERGRIYIPQEHLARHGWDEARLAAAERRGGRSLQARAGDDFRQVLEPLVNEAEAMLLAGQPLVDRVHPDLRLPIRVFLEGGRAILAAIRFARYDVWSRRPAVGRLTKFRILARAWWRG